MTTGSDVRRALELLCRKVNPPHQLETRRVDLAALGLTRPDFSRISLRGAYLRGLSPGAATIGDEPGSLAGAWLEGGDWSVSSLRDEDLVRSQVVDVVLPQDLDPGASSLRQVRVDSLRPRTAVVGHVVRAIAVLRDERVVSAVGDQLVVWDLATGSVLEVLQGHRGFVQSVSELSGERVVSGGDDGTVRVWGLSGEGELSVLEGHRGAVWSVSELSGDSVVSGGVDGVRLWNVPAGRCEAWWRHLSTDVWWRADLTGITLTHRSRPWRSVQRGGKLLPEDAVLHRYAGYVAEARFFVPVRLVPELIEIDAEHPNVFRQRWPPAWDEERIQSYLGRARQPHEG